MDQWPNYTTQNTAHYIKHQAEALSDWLPCLRGVKFMRIWGGLADMTPDMAPIMDGNDPVTVSTWIAAGAISALNPAAPSASTWPVHGHRELPGHAQTIQPAPLRKPPADGRNRRPGELHTGQLTAGNHNAIETRYA
jgi:glycine/D-amino acid oxidase-like deaminating enzyme